MLTIESLVVRYGRVTAVSAVSLTVEKGEAVLIVGPNGAGKSSTMLSVAGVVKPAAGNITFDGQSVSGFAAEELCRLGLSMVPEGRDIFPALTVEENLMIGTYMRRDRASIPGDLSKTLQRFPVLGDRLRGSAGKLSGGEQQQLAIARALMTRPKMLLIDEPSLGLAPMMVDRVYQALGELRREGTTLLIVEQNLRRAMAFADRLYVLREGAVQLSGTPHEFNGRQDIEAAYFGVSTQAVATLAESP